MVHQQIARITHASTIFLFQGIKKDRGWGKKKNQTHLYCVCFTVYF